jgi:hypothetical protein
MQKGTSAAGNNCSKEHKYKREQQRTGFAWNRFSMRKKPFGNSFIFTNRSGSFTSKSFPRKLVLLIKKNILRTNYNYFAKTFWVVMICHPYEFVHFCAELTHDAFLLPFLQ